MVALVPNNFNRFQALGVQSSGNTSYPVGSIIPTNGISPGKNWVQCVGQSFNTATYPTLSTLYPNSVGIFTNGSFGGAYGLQLATNGTNFVMVASNAGYYATSTDGINFTNRTLSNSSAQLNGIIWTGTCYVAACTNTYPWVSTDGITFTQPVTSGNNYYAVFQMGANTVVAGGASGAVYSPNPLTTPYSAFTTSPTNFGGSTSSCLYGNGSAAIFSQSSTSYSTCFDGLNWVNRTLPFTFGSTSYGPTISPGVFYKGLYVISAGGAGIYTSPDLINWTNRSPGTISGVTLVGNLLVGMVDSSNSTLTTMVTSFDGITWTSNTTNLKVGYPTHMLFSNGRVYVCGYTQVSYASGGLVLPTAPSCYLLTG